MFIFIRLLLAHFIADYILQSDRIYGLKLKGLKGGIPHSLIVLLTASALSWPYLNLPAMWGLLVVIGASHLFLDWFYSCRLKKDGDFWAYLLDQLLHILVIMLLFFTALKDLTPPRETGGFFVALYNNDILLIYLVAVIIASYNGFYLTTKFKKTFLAEERRHSPFEKWYGIFERAAGVSCFFLGGAFFFLIPVVALLRLPVFALYKDTAEIDKRFVSPLEIALSWIIAVIAGGALYAIIGRWA